MVNPTRIDINGQRFYKCGDKKYPSVTNVLWSLDKKGIEHWKKWLQQTMGVEEGIAEAKRISTESLAVGSELHLVIENYLRTKTGMKAPKQKRVAPIFKSMLPALKKITDISAQEKPMFSDKLGLAGTVDCIAKYDGTRCVIDFKNSRKVKKPYMVKKYFLQTTAYSIMWEEMTGEKIEDLCIIIGVWDKEPQVFLGNRADYIDKLWEVLIDYAKNN